MSAASTTVSSGGGGEDAELSLPRLGFHTSEALIKALKGTQDPIDCEPQSPLPSISRIRLAALAWRQHRLPEGASASGSTSALYVPGLAQLLPQWILDTLSNAVRPSVSKDKARAAQSSWPLELPSYFTLLSELLQQEDANASSWRYTPQSLLRITSALVSLDTATEDDCFNVAVEPITSLLVPHLHSLAVTQTTRSELDHLIELLCKRVARLESADDDSASSAKKLLSAIVVPWRDAALESVQLGTRSYEHFVSETLGLWAEAVHRTYTIASPIATSSSPLEDLQSTLWQCAEVALFSAAGLRAILSPPSSGAKSLVESLQQASEGSRLHVLPGLATAALDGCRKHSAELSSFLKGPKNSAEAPTDSTPSMYRAFLESIYRPFLAACSSEGTANSHARAAATARQELLNLTTRRKMPSAITAAPLWSVTLRQTLQAIANDLRSSPDAVVVETAIASCRVIWTVDEELARRALDSLLDAILHEPNAQSWAASSTQLALQGFLDDLLSSFSSVQELPSLLTILQQHLGSSLVDLFANIGSPFDPTALNNAVSKSFASFLPPTQIVEVIESIATSLETAARQTPSSENNQSSSKKRSAESDADHNTFTQTSNLLRLAQPILASLVVPTALATDAESGLKRIASALQEAVQRGLHVTRSPKKQKNNGRVGGLETSPSVQSGIRQAASSLWCWYGLASGQRASAVANGESAGCAECLTILQTIWPETAALHLDGAPSEEAAHLRNELVRALLFQQELEQEALRSSGMASLSVAQRELELWNSAVRTLGAGPSSPSRDALWEMLCRRWIIVLERAATQADLRTLADLLVSTLPPSAPQETMRASSLHVVENAEFLELGRWRASVLDAIDQASNAESASAGRALSVLVHFPLQYFPPSRREALMLRCLELLASPREEQVLNVRERIAVRHWLQKTVHKDQPLSTKVASALAAAVLRLVRAQGTIRGDELSVSNLALFSAASPRLLESKSFGQEELQKLIAATQQHELFMMQLAEVLARSSSESLKNIKLTQFDLERLTDASVVDLPFSGEEFKRLRLTLVLAKLQGAAEGAQDTGAKAVVDRLCSSAFAETATALAARESDGLSDELLVEWTLLMGTCMSRLQDAAIAVRFALTFSSLLAASATPTPSKELQQAFSEVISRLTPNAYAAVLKMLLTAIEMTELHDSVTLRSLLFTLGRSLRQGPESTLLIAQKGFTALLTKIETIASDLKNTLSAASLLECLQAIQSVSSGRAMVFRPADAGLVLSFLSHTLAPGQTMAAVDPHVAGPSASSILLTIIAILSDLVRLRRDLLIPIIPQLTVVLSQFSPLFRQPLPQASLLQRARLTGQQPGWLLDSADSQSAFGLGPLDAREVSRLFTTLTAKTVASLNSAAGGRGLTASSRRGRGDLTGSGGTTASGPIVDSLSKPLSKHAIYIVLSYVHSLLQPSGSFIPPDIKRELIPGLVSLCGVVSNDTLERDWVLASGDLLDQTGKTIFKDEVWREYERTKYRGD